MPSPRPEAAAAARLSGGIDARDLTGGMQAWQGTGLPVRVEDKQQGTGLPVRVEDKQRGTG